MQLVYPRNANSRLVVTILWVVVIVLNGAAVCAETVPQASTLDELITMFDSSSCKECHKEIYEQWEKSHHARSLGGFSGLPGP